MSGGPRKRIKYGDKPRKTKDSGYKPTFRLSASFALEQRHDNWSNTM
jgi:hypothetical protein